MKNRSVLKQNIILLDLLKKIGYEAHKSGIEIIVLKGCALLGREYQDFGNRQMSDIDLLIQPTDKNSIFSILERIGGKEKSQPMPDVYHRFCIHDKFLFYFGNICYSVEVHYALIPQLRFKINYLMAFEAAQPHPLDDLAEIGLKRLSPEMLLIHLSLHRLSHLYLSNSKDLNDAVRVIEKNQVDTQQIKTISLKWKISHIVYFFVLMVVEIYRCSNGNVSNNTLIKVEEILRAVNPGFFRKVLIFIFLNPGDKNPLRISILNKSRKIVFNFLFASGVFSAIKYPCLNIILRIKSRCFRR